MSHLSTDPFYCGAVGGYEKSSTLVESTLRAQHSSTARQLLKTKKTLKRVTRSFWVFAPPPPSQVAALGKRGAWQESISEADSAIRGGLSPDAYVYGSCVGAAAHSGRWREAMDLLCHMRGEGIAPTTPVFNAAIKACSKGGKLKLTLALLDDMCAYGAPPVVDVAGPDSFRPRGKCGNSRPDDEAEAKTDLLREVQRGWRGGGGGVGTEDRSSAPTSRRPTP